MSRFNDKALSRIAKLSPEEIARILESRNNELALRTQILDSVEMGYLLVDKEGNVLCMNSVLYDHAECYRRKNTGSVTVDRLFRDPELVKYIKNVLKTGSKDEYNYVLEKASYGRADIRVYWICPGQSEHYIFCFQDVTVFRKIREEYLKNESLAAMTTMAAGIAHEIKNPLASISIYLQLLQRKLKENGVLREEDASKSLQVISDEIERLNAITVDFLFAVKPMNVKPSLADVNTVVMKAVAVAGPEAEQQGIKLITDNATSLPNVEIDVNLIEQCILNLIRNAVQAMCPESDLKEIKVGTRLEGDMVRISVSDTGCGMTDETMSKIFEPYYTTKAGGTGLGLTNIFKIMKLHNGNVSVTSEYGKGSEFILSIPVPRSQRFRIEA